MMTASSDRGGDSQSSSTSTSSSTSSSSTSSPNNEHDSMGHRRGNLRSTRPWQSAALTSTSTSSASSVSSTSFIPHGVVSVACGLVAGMAQAGLFNPFDRALYLSVVNHTPFLSSQNFQRPYQGFFQSVGHRALSGGLYFPLERFFMDLLPTQQQHHPHFALNKFLAGTAAGAVNALICNPVAAVKYKTWGRDVNRGMLQEAILMLRKGGIRPFYNGLIPTLLRDLTFGGTYTLLRFEFQDHMSILSSSSTKSGTTGTSDMSYPLLSNGLAAALATIVSGPFNLARNVQYATKSRHIADPVWYVLTEFTQQVSEQPTLRAKWIHVQNRLRLGWGTARVALGMAFGHYVYDKLLRLYDETSFAPSMMDAS